MSFYVTTPIYYVNAAPHLGHAYTTIAADVMARHHRQRGEDVFFLTGTDEHGEPVALAAEAAGVTPRELADKNAERFKALAPVLNVTNDFFIRTSDPEHVKAVQEVLTKVKDNGYVELGLYEGWYCPRCADFKSESEIVDGNRCPIHLIELTWEQEENYFFKLSKLQERLEQLYEEQPGFVTPSSRRNEALSFIKSGLNDVSLTRGKLTWGVPVPWDESHVFYVWFDALLNYYTALTYARPGEDLRDEFWPAQRHLIAKDILKFHCVFWPALLMAADLPLPKNVFVHGYLLLEGHKMSKSLGNVLDPFEVIEKFGSDALRFYLLRDVSFGQDGAVSTEDFEKRYESELANDYGNLASRTIKMLLRYRDGAVPQVDLDPAVAAEFDGLVDRVSGQIGDGELTAALEDIWVRVRRLNAYVGEQEPWKLSKDPERAADLDRVLATLAEGIRVVTVLLHAWIPDRADRLLGALGAEGLDGTDTAPALAIATASFGAAVPARVADIEPLFPKQQPAPGRVIDSHTHLDSCAEDDAELIAEARAVGVTRILTIGQDGPTGEAALAAARAFPGVVFAGIGHHPNKATGFGDAELETITQLAADPACRAIGETGLDDFREYAPRADQERAFHAQIDLARALAKPLVIHTRAADDDTIATLRSRAAGVRVILHCFSMPDRVDECLAEGWFISFAGNVTYPKNTDLAAAVERVPDDRILVETDAPYLTPQPLRKHRNQPAYVTETAQFVAERRGQAYAELEAIVERNAAELFAW